MAIRYAIDSGPWSQPGVWDGAGFPPSAGDQVYSNGFTVEIEFSGYNVSLLSSEKLTVGEDLVAVAGGGFLITQSNITFTASQMRCGSGDLLTVTGSNATINGGNIYGGQPFGLPSGSHMAVVMLAQGVVTGTATGRMDTAVYLAHKDASFVGTAVGGIGSIAYGYEGYGVELHGGATMIGNAYGYQSGNGGFAGCRCVSGGKLIGDAHGGNSTMASGVTGAVIENGGIMIGNSFGTIFNSGAIVRYGGYQRGNATGGPGVIGNSACGTVVTNGGMFEGNVVGGGSPSVPHGAENHGVNIYEGGWANIGLASGGSPGNYGVRSGEFCYVRVNKSSGVYAVSLDPTTNQDIGNFPFYRRGKKGGWNGGFSG